MAVGSWHNFTHSNFVFKKVHFKYLFRIIMVLSTYHTYSWQGIACCLLCDIRISTLLFLNLMNIVIFGMPCVASANLLQVTCNIRENTTLETFGINDIIYCILSLINILLMCSGDISPNPGPSFSNPNPGLRVSHLNVQTS